METQLVEIIPTEAVQDNGNQETVAADIVPAPTAMQNPHLPVLNACHAAMGAGMKLLTNAFATTQHQELKLSAGAGWRPIPQSAPSQPTVVRKPPKSQHEPYCCKACFECMAQKMFGVSSRGRPPHDKGCLNCSK